MSTDQSPNLLLPFMLSSQGDKHVTYNETIQALDTLVQLGVVSRGLVTPPSAPTQGQRFIIAANAIDGWSGKAGQIASWQLGAWQFLPPKAGWIAWVADEQQLLVFGGQSWAPCFSVSSIAGLGINTSHDLYNRLSAKTEAVSFSYDEGASATGNIQLALNKKLAGNTASVLFKAQNVGCAEIGCTGDNKLHIKVSPDGQTWLERVTIDNQTGRIGLGHNVTNPDFDLDIACPARYSGSWQWNDALQTHLGTVGNYPSSNYYRKGDAGRSVAMGWDPGSRAIFFNRWNFTTDAHLGMILQITQAGDLLFHAHATPGSDNVYSLGTSAARWSVVYAATGIIATSDKRLKTNIVDCPLGLDFICSLAPKLYRWTKGGNDVEWSQDDSKAGFTRPQVHGKPGARLHAGFMAQDVKLALDDAGVDCGLWVLDDTSAPHSTQSLRYDQFIAPMVQAIKQLNARIHDLEHRLL